MAAERSAEGAVPMPEVPGADLVPPPLSLEEAHGLFDAALGASYDPILVGARIRDLTRSLHSADEIERWSILAYASSRAARHALSHGDGETAGRYFHDAQVFHSSVEDRLY